MEFSEPKLGFGPHTLAGRGNAGQAQRKWLLASSLLWTKPIFCRNDRTTHITWMRIVQNRGGCDQAGALSPRSYLPCCSKHQIPEETHTIVLQAASAVAFPLFVQDASFSLLGGMDTWLACFPSRVGLSSRQIGNVFVCVNSLFRSPAVNTAIPRCLEFPLYPTGKRLRFLSSKPYSVSTQSWWPDLQAGPCVRQPGPCQFCPCQ